MNSASEIRLRRIQAFGRVARGVCSIAIAFTLMLAAPWGFYRITKPWPDHPFDLDLGPVSFGGENLEPAALQFWIGGILVVNLVLFVWILWLVRGVFDHLARGEIYTAGPVRRLQVLGRVLLMGACLQIIVPLATLLVLNTNLISVPHTIQFTARIYAGTFTGFAAAGVVMLLSWVLDVGLGVREEADALRRDAELVV